MSKIVNLINSAVAYCFVVAAEDSVVANLEAAAAQAASSIAVRYFAEADFAVADQTVAPRLPALLLSAADCGIPAA